MRVIPAAALGFIVSSALAQSGVPTDQGTAYWRAHGAPAAALAGPLKAAAAPSRFIMPRYGSGCVLDGVLALMGLTLRGELPIPYVYLESLTPLRQFQDAVEPQWGVRPDMFLNAYAAARNEIYLINDAEYYDRLGRFVDDSLAHELAHYIQVKYKNIPIELFDDSMEHEAVAVQTEFRDTYLKAGRSPCGR